MSNKRLKSKFLKILRKLWLILQFCFPYNLKNSYEFKEIIYKWVLLLKKRHWIVLHYLLFCLLIFNFIFLVISIEKIVCFKK